MLRRAFRGGERVTVRTDLPVRGTRNGDFTFRTARIPRRVTIQNLILENIDARLVRRFRSRRDLAPPFVNVEQRRGRPVARAAVPQPEVQEGPEAGRADDRRRRGAAGLVPAAAGHPGGHRLPRADLQGQAGPHVLEGHLAPGHRRRRDGHARPVLPRDPPDPHGQRLPPGPARVRDHAQRHRDHHRLSGRAHRPAEGQGRRPRPARRLGDPGDRPRHRARRVRVALARQDPPDRDVLHAARGPARAVRLRAHQLGQPRHRRRLPDVGPQHLDDLQDRPRDGRHPLAPRRQAEHLQARAAARFAWQHDAQRRSDGAITLFDNEAFPPIRKNSRALALRLDEGARTAARRAR